VEKIIAAQARFGKNRRLKAVETVFSLLARIARTMACGQGSCTHCVQRIAQEGGKYNASAFLCSKDAIPQSWLKQIPLKKASLKRGLI
jgi:hypothetical protein